MRLPSQALPTNWQQCHHAVRQPSLGSLSPPLAPRRRSELAEFVLLALKAATHHILFLRQAYPATEFHKERVFDTYTQAARHPALKSYIAEVLDSVRVRRRDVPP